MEIKKQIIRHAELAAPLVFEQCENYKGVCRLVRIKHLKRFECCIDPEINSG